MTRVLIADDHALFRAGLRQFLVDALPSAEIGEAASGNRGPDLLQRQGWDMLILDINMPDRTGLDICAREVGASCHALWCSRDYPSASTRERYCGRARGLHSRRTPPRRISLKPCAWCWQGRRYVSDRLAELLVLDLDRADKPLHALLPTGSSRSSASWPQDRGFRDRPRALLSVKTVSTYRRRILEKMQ